MKNKEISHVPIWGYNFNNINDKMTQNLTKKK